MQPCSALVLCLEEACESLSGQCHFCNTIPNSGCCFVMLGMFIQGRVSPPSLPVPPEQPCCRALAVGMCLGQGQQRRVSCAPLRAASALPPQPLGLF